jgi:tRNA(fMet)-specific endonuclease VapC
VSATYLLDTDICIYAMKRRSASVLARFDELLPGEALISIVGYGELLFGLSKSTHPATASSNLAVLTARAAVAMLPLEAAQQYAEIRRYLEPEGRPIGSNDAWIAAHALAAGLTLVTNNEREFRRVPGLRLENWAKAGVAERPGGYRRRRRLGGPAMDDVPPVDPVADIAMILGLNVATLREQVDQLNNGIRSDPDLA